jgi:hypothetical protein
MYKSFPFTALFVRQLRGRLLSYSKLISPSQDICLDFDAEKQCFMWISPKVFKEKVYHFRVSESFLDNNILGDIEDIRLNSVRNEITIRHSFLKISSADELYHTQWENVEDEYVITLPELKFPYIIELNPELVDRPTLLSPKIWIASVTRH